MLDYSLNNFQKESFILDYDIDPEDKTIMVNYANQKSEVLPLTIQNEKMILERMKRQVTGGNNFYKTAKKARRKFKIIDRLYKILYTALLGMFIGLAVKEGFIIGLITALACTPFMVFNPFMKENKKCLKYLNSVLNDYEKDLDFLNNSEEFTNEKVIRPYVISNTTDKVRFVISAGILIDKYDAIKEGEGYNLVDYRVYDDEHKDKEESLKYQNERKAKGYFEVNNREIPFININNTDLFSHEELADLYKLTTSKDNTPGKVLVKTYKIKDINNK